MTLDSANVGISAQRNRTNIHMRETTNGGVVVDFWSAGNANEEHVFVSKAEAIAFVSAMWAPEASQPEQPEIPEGFEREGVELGDGSEPSSQMTLDEANIPRGADGNEIRVGDVWTTTAGSRIKVRETPGPNKRGYIDDGPNRVSFGMSGKADAPGYDFAYLISRAETAPDAQEDVEEDSEWHPFESFLYCDTFEIDILCEDGVIHRGLTADDVRSWSSAGENHSPIKFAKVVRDLSEEESAPEPQEGVSEGDDVAEEAETLASESETPGTGQVEGVADIWGREAFEKAAAESFAAREAMLAAHIDQQAAAANPDADTDEVADPLDETEKA